jgi:hypothetical protein
MGEPYRGAAGGSCCQKTSAVRCWNTPLEKTTISDGLGSKTILIIRLCASSSRPKGSDTLRLNSCEPQYSVPIQRVVAGRFHSLPKVIRSPRGQNAI